MVGEQKYLQPKLHVQTGGRKSAASGCVLSVEWGKEATHKDQHLLHNEMSSVVKLSTPQRGGEKGNHGNSNQGERIGTE